MLAMKDGAGLDYRCFWHEDEPRSDPYRLEPDHAGPIDLCLNGAAVVRVQVVDDADSGIPGVQIWPWYFVKPQRGDKANVTAVRSFGAHRPDVDGVAEVAYIPSDCQQRVPFRPHLKGYCAPARCVWDPKSGVGEVKTSLTALIPVDGTVVNAYGTPAAGAVVHVGGEGLSLDDFRRQGNSRRSRQISHRCSSGEMLSLRGISGARCIDPADANNSKTGQRRTRPPRAPKRGAGARQSHRWA